MKYYREAPKTERTAPNSFQKSLPRRVYIYKQERLLRATLAQAHPKQIMPTRDKEKLNILEDAHTRRGDTPTF